MLVVYGGGNRRGETRAEVSGSFNACCEPDSNPGGTERQQAASGNYLDHLAIRSGPVIENIR